MSAKNFVNSDMVHMAHARMPQRLMLCGCGSGQGEKGHRGVDVREETGNGINEEMLPVTTPGMIKPFFSVMRVFAPVVTSAPLWSAAEEALKSRTGPPGCLERSGT